MIYFDFFFGFEPFVGSIAMNWTMGMCNLLFDESAPATALATLFSRTAFLFSFVLRLRKLVVCFLMPEVSLCDLYANY